MNWEIVVVAVIAAMPGIWSLIQSRSKTSAERSLIEAQAKTADAQEEGIRIDTLNKIIAALQTEASLLRKEQDDFRSRLVIAETRAATAEARAATAEGRSLDYERLFNTARADIVKLGEDITRERTENQGRVNKIALLVARLIEQLKRLGASPEITADEIGILDKLIIVGG